MVNAPAVVNAPASEILPPNAIVLDAFCTSSVTVLPAFSAIEDVAAIVTSNAADVSLTASPANAVMLPPLIVGAVKVLFVRVCARFTSATVSVVAGIVIVPEITPLAGTTESVPDVEPASVNPPDPIAGVVNDGDVKVLLVNVCVESRSASTWFAGVEPYLTLSPDVVNHASPVFGDVGAAPAGIFNDAPADVDAPNVNVLPEVRDAVPGNVNADGIENVTVPEGVEPVAVSVI